MEGFWFDMNLQMNFIHSCNEMNQMITNIHSNCHYSTSSFQWMIAYSNIRSSISSIFNIFNISIFSIFSLVQTYQTSFSFPLQDICLFFDEGFVKEVDSPHFLCHFHAIIVHQEGMVFVHQVYVFLEYLLPRPIGFILPFLESLRPCDNCVCKVSFILDFLAFYAMNRPILVVRSK